MKTLEGLGDDKETAEPASKSRPARRRGLGWLQLRGRIWWIGYCFRGRTYRESSHSTNRADAVKLLRRRLAEIGQGRLIGPDAEKVTFEEIKQLVLTDYRVNGRRSRRRAELAFKRLDEFFARYRALEITPDQVMRYIERRLVGKMKPATIQYEIAVLRRGLTLAFRAGKLPSRPHVPSIEVRNVRTGFFEDGEFRELLRHLPDHLTGLVEFMYLTGWRIGEVLALTWSQIDFKVGLIRLEPQTTKNDDGRSFPFLVLPSLEAVLRKQRASTTEVERKTNAIIPWVFHKDGNPIKELRDVWKKASEAAGLSGRIVHDFRRTAVRNLERAGVPRSVAMKLTGHKTESVYRRYAIVAEADLREGVEKLARLHAGRAAAPASVRTTRIVLSLEKRRPARPGS